VTRPAPSPYKSPWTNPSPNFLPLCSNFALGRNPNQPDSDHRRRWSPSRTSP
jgi:hypothetical protein